MATTSAAIPLFVGYRWWRRLRREREIERALAANGTPLAIPEHLSPTLVEIACETRRLRLELETPVRRVRPPLLSETPWARRARCEEYDAALYEVRRAIWEWLRSLERLGKEELVLLGELGLSVVPFRRLLFGCDRTSDVWEQVVYMKAPDLELVWTELRRTMHELDRFERALLRGPRDPYR